MAFTKVGQTKLGSFVQVPVIDYSKLGGEKTFKDFFSGFYIPLGFFNSESKTINTPDTTGDLVDVQHSKHTMFKYTWCEPKQDGKKGELSWHNVQWSDCGLRVEEGDTYDDPGFSLGLHIKQDNRRTTPGLNGAPSGKYPMFDAANTTIRIPILWKPEVVDGEVMPKTGEFAWLELSNSQFSSLMDAMVLGEKQARINMKRTNKSVEPDTSKQLYIVQLVKDPKASMADRNTVSVIATCDDDISSWMNQASKEYPKHVKYLLDTYRWYQPTIDAAIEGQIDMELAIETVHASIARKLLVGWGLIDAEDGPSDAEVNEMFVRLIPQYTQSLTVADASGAILDTTTINLAGDDGDAEPF